MNILKTILLSLVLGMSSTAVATPVLTLDLPSPTPAYFNGFQSIPHDGIHFLGGSVYAEGGITARQMHADAGYNIWVTLGGMSDLSWYPNGGDFGYTDITMTSGADFTDVSFEFRAYAGGNLQYSLLDNGVQVLAGIMITESGALSRAGFVGGGFDQVRLRSGNTGSFGDGRGQALQIDNIQSGSVTAIPEPGTVTLLGLGMIGLLMRRRSKSS